MVIPLGPVTDQSRITPRHLILNLIRRMSPTSLHTNILREQFMSQLYLTTTHIITQTSAWYLMKKYKEQQMVRIGTHVQADQYTHMSACDALLNKEVERTIKHKDVVHNNHPCGTQLRRHPSVRSLLSTYLPIKANACRKQFY